MDSHNTWINFWGADHLDMVVLLSDASLSAVERRARYEPQDLPVPADLWVYTRAEWEELSSQAPLLRQRLQREMLDLTGDEVA